MTQVLYKGRLIPQSVAQAIASGDHEKLKVLSARGQEEKARRKQWRDAQGVLKFPKNCTPRRPVSKESVAKALETRAYNQVRQAEWEESLRKDAEEHADATRAGWDDDYRP